MTAWSFLICGICNASHKNEIVAILNHQKTVIKRALSVVSEEFAKYCIVYFQFDENECFLHFDCIIVALLHVRVT